MTTILDGKKLSNKILEDLESKLSTLKTKPSLAVILVGENPASQLYVGMKKKTADKIGINSSVINYPQNIDQDTLLAKIKELNEDENTNAILVQLPLPKHIDSKKVLQTISPKKDVDGLTPENLGRITFGTQPYVYPCTPKGIMLLLEEYSIGIEGKHVVIVGRSNIVGKPLALMMLNKNATVTICHSKTENLADIVRTADIVVSAVGKNKIIKNEMIKNNSVIIDVGVSKIDGKTCGDVDFENVFAACSYISPCIGGVGPMTIASLMMNTYELYSLTQV